MKNHDVEPGRFLIEEDCGAFNLISTHPEDAAKSVGGRRLFLGQYGRESDAETARRLCQLARSRKEQA